jgi:hypothetical protein
VSEKGIYTALAVVGFVTTLAISFFSERAEAWDSPLYFVAGLPVMALAAGIAGWHCPHLTWSFGFTVIAGSMAWMWGANKFAIGTLFPFGIVFAAVLSLACSGAARIGSALRRRRKF